MRLLALFVIRGYLKLNQNALPKLGASNPFSVLHYVARKIISEEGTVVFRTLLNIYNEAFQTGQMIELCSEYLSVRCI